MTYQIVMCGKEGLVVASDKRELRESGGIDQVGHGFSANMLSKIYINSAHSLAWAFAGGEISRIAAAYLDDAFNNASSDLSIEEVKQTIVQCGNSAWKDYARGPQQAVVTLVIGPTRTILRATITPTTVVDELSGTHPVFAGQAHSQASLLPTRFYSRDMTIPELAFLAGCTIRMAHEADPQIIDGLDIAAYRDATKSFELLDPTLYWDRAKEIDAVVMECIRRNNPA